MDLEKWKIRIFRFLVIEISRFGSASAQKIRGWPPFFKMGIYRGLHRPFHLWIPNFEKWNEVSEPDREVFRKNSKGSNPHPSRRKTPNQPPWKLLQVVRPPSRKNQEFCEKNAFFWKIDFWPHFFDLGIKNESFFDPFLAHSGVAKLAPDACEAILRPFFSKLEKKDHVWSARARKISKNGQFLNPKIPFFAQFYDFSRGRMSGVNSATRFGDDPIP